MKYSKEIGAISLQYMIQRFICKNIHISISYDNQKIKINQTLTEWLNKLRYVYAVRHHAITKNISESYLVIWEDLHNNIKWNLGENYSNIILLNIFIHVHYIRQKANFGSIIACINVAIKFSALSSFLQWVWIRFSISTTIIRDWYY